MKINSIHIDNFRVYKSFDCNFSEGVNIVIGNNGAGKTSLLSAISLYLSALLSGYGVHESIQEADPYMEVTKAGEATLSIRELFPVSFSGKIELEKGKVEEYVYSWSDMNTAICQGASTALYEYNEKAGSIWPLMSYQRFDRDLKIGKGNDKRVTIETGLNERKDGYNDCLKGIGCEEKIRNWCLKMSMLEFERKDTIQEFTTFKSIIKSFMQTIEDIKRDFEVSYSVEFSGLVLKIDNTITPLYELSTGYKALLSMIMELAYRAVLLNPGISDLSEHQTGIVIIDELDAHLHPKWQWKVLDALETCFPKVQFIVATHSPIIISSAKKANMIILEKGTVIYSEGAYGYNVDDVLNLRQGSPSAPRITENLTKKLEAAFDEGDMDQADKIVLDAKKEFGSDSPVYKELKDYLDINRWIEEA